MQLYLQLIVYFENFYLMELYLMKKDLHAATSQKIMGPLCIFCRITNNFYIKIGIFLVKNASKIAFFDQKWTFFSQKFSGSRSRKIFGRDPDLDPEISSIPKMVFGIGRDPGPDPGRDPGFRSRNRDPVRALSGMYP